MPRVRVRDIEMHYELQGAGSRVLFIGGTGGDLRQKPNVFDGPLAEAHEVLAFDQRGLGQTDRPPGPYHMADYGDDAAGLLDALGWERCALIGVSFGGMVAQELALRHPERVERLALVCTSAGGAGGASYPLHELERLPAEERALLGLELADTRQDAAWRAANAESVEKLLAFQRQYAEAGEGEPGRAEGQRLQLEARSHHDTFERLPALDLPVLVCGGRHDGIAPLSNQEAMANAIPGARLELFEGGHMFLVQDPRAWRCILGFLDAA